MTVVPWRRCTRCSTAFIAAKYQRVCDSCLSTCTACGVEIKSETCVPKRLRKCDGCRSRTQSLRELKVVNPDAYERELARLRLKSTMRRRVATKFTDVTRSYEIRIRKSARWCAICGNRLAAERHVDHIVPIELGGTHTRDNLRVTCPACNLGRPRDYSDIGHFQMNLWMGTDASAERVAVHVNRAFRIDRTCSKCGLSESVPDSRTWRRDMVCFDCRGKYVPNGPRRSRSSGPPRPPKMRYDGKYDMGLVVRLREAGHGYKRIASAIGVTRNTARELVRRAVALGLVEA